MGLNPKQVNLLLIFFPIPSNPWVMGLTEQGLNRDPDRFDLFALPHPYIDTDRW
jgi:hypothetical protein